MNDQDIYCAYCGDLLGLGPKEVVIFCDQDCVDLFDDMERENEVKA